MKDHQFLNKIAEFLLEANEHGYAAYVRDTKEPDNSHTIEYSSGDWRYHDNYFGGEPYGGREAVFFKGKPVYMMVYYGSVNQNIGTHKVYPFLRKALLIRQKENPYRGPKLFEEGNLRYVNDWVGEVDNFNGEERIFDGDSCIYSAKYMGGLVDQR